MKEKVEQIKTEVLNKLSNIKDLKELDSIRLEYLSKKGKITEYKRINESMWSDYYSQVVKNSLEGGV